MALGSTLAILGLGAAGMGAKKGIDALVGGAKTNVNAPIPLPQAPSPVAAEVKGQEMVRKKKASASQSVYTSPLGSSGEAQVARKTLLGT